MPKIWKAKRAMENAQRLAGTFYARGNTSLGDSFHFKYVILRDHLEGVNLGYYKV